MAEFLISFKKTGRVEAGIANDPKDSGGLTYAGIAFNSHPNWEGWPLIKAVIAATPGKPWTEPWIDAVNRKLAASQSLQMLVLKFFKSIQWDVMNLDLLNDQRVADELYDTGVNMGTGRAGIFFQRVLNVINREGSLFPDLTLDGQIGPKTVASFNKLNAADKSMVWRLLNCLQGEKYISICEANPSQERFMRSWASRVFEA